MGWAVGYDNDWERDVGYGVPAYCDHPRCKKEIDRGLGYVCGSDIYGGEHGCGLFFCGEHTYSREPRGSDRSVASCKRCMTYKLPYKPKPDHPDWIEHKLTDESWAGWRATQSEEALNEMKKIVGWA